MTGDAFPYLEIDGWIVKKDMDGHVLSDCPLNREDYYMVTLIKNFVIECSFLKKDYESIPKEERHIWLKNKLQDAIFEYGTGRNFPWMK